MKLRKPWLLKLIGFASAWLIRMWMATVRYRLIMWDREQHPTNPRDKRFIYAFFHEAILFPTRLRTKAHILISHHADGELIAQACRHLGFKTIRGSTARGGTQALWQLMSISKKTHLMVTPDGPRGPRRQVQMGLIFLASYTGLPIIPCGVGYQKAWRFRSWDHFALPWPGTTGVVVAGAAISVPPRLNRKKLEEYRLLVEQRMLEATAAAEHLAEKAGRKAASENKEANQWKASA